jgi:hypothetical protein
MPEHNHSKTDSQNLEPSGPARIKALVQMCRVCWEVHPVQILAKDGIRKVGFDLELYGTPECGTAHITPGCQDCLRVESALEEIANWILRPESPTCSCEVSADGALLSYAPTRANRPDVVVRIHIVHRHGWDQPTDECEVRCLKDIEQKLTELGACEGRWSDAR